MIGGSSLDRALKLDLATRARQARLRDAQVKAGITPLEPSMKVMVVAPDSYQGAQAGDINRRHGETLNFLSDKGRCSIHAYIPLAELFGYTSD